MTQTTLDNHIMHSMTTLPLDGDKDEALSRLARKIRDRRYSKGRTAFHRIAYSARAGTLLRLLRKQAIKQGMSWRDADIRAVALLQGMGVAYDMDTDTYYPRDVLDATGKDLRCT